MLACSVDDGVRQRAYSTAAFEDPGGESRTARKVSPPCGPEKHLDRIPFGASGNSRASTALQRDSGGHQLMPRPSVMS